ncbi:uncharacterized protein LOC143881894 [Tasmannia lanceolata]|uniref:uncharacterized protein LOC143881894 n=1 Tax=Tasmannia lanceolata TaxID=3420 RepID=UPI0040649542
MKKYGLQLRVPPSSQQQQKKPTITRPPLPPPLGFGDNDEEDDVENEIARQASKKRALKEIEEQHKKALEEDPTVFDYDGVYDEMKEKIARPIVQDRQERKSKYIERLMEKAKERERVHEIVYERKIAKERSKDDHLFADKEKFVTSGYKKKLAEQAKWFEEERLRELREQKEDVTKKGDLSDFYFNLTKNVAFGAQSTESGKPAKHSTSLTDDNREIGSRPAADASSNSTREKSSDPAETSTRSRNSSDPKPASLTSPQENIVPEPPSADQTADQTAHNRHMRSEDALAAAKERYLSRKRAKDQ